MIKKILIIGKGSIGNKHYNILHEIDKNFIILQISSRKFYLKNLELIKKIKFFNPDYIIIASPSIKHLNDIKIFELLFNKKIILVEKPLFNKKNNLSKIIKNKYFVGYNLRFNPVLIFLKKFLNKKNFFYVNITCSSYLPNWRKKNNYRKSVSAKKELGGGAILELSHEIDYLIWIFGKIKKINSLNKKISNLKINTDDLLLLHGKKNKIHINLNINFFSRVARREIIVDGNRFSLIADILNNTITIIKEGKKLIKKFKKNKNNKTYKLQHLAIIKKEHKFLCSLKEANNVLDLIEKIKK
jgi:predicted dehydrogenase